MIYLLKADRECFDAYEYQYYNPYKQSLSAIGLILIHTMHQDFNSRM